MKNAFSTVVACFLTTASPALGQESSPAGKLPSGFGEGAGMVSRAARDLSPALAELVAKHNVPGMAAAVIDTRGLVAVGAAGVRVAGGDAAVTLDDRWHLGSCGKAMTGTLAGLLVADGTLRWDSTIDEVFNPARSEKQKISNNWRLVRLRNLTTCSAGVTSDLGEYGGRPLWSDMWNKAREGGPPREQRAFLFNELVKGNIAPPTSTGGAGFQYANASLAVAGHLMEEATGTPFEDLIRQRLFLPLGMHGTGFGAPGTKESTTPDQPWGHTSRGTPVPPGVSADNPPSIAPAGTIHMPIGDWARFARLHLIGATLSMTHPVGFDETPSSPDYNPSDTLGLAPADFAVLHAPGTPSSDYAAGWIITTRPWAKGSDDGAKGVCLTHVGSNTMWTASIWIAPEIGRGYLAVVNSGSNAAGEAREAALLTLINTDRDTRGMGPVKP